MAMPEIVAVLGLFLFWASLFWLPLMVVRAIGNRGGPQIWSIAGIFAFGMVLFGYTRAMAMGTLNEALAWSVAWGMPVALALYARSVPDALWRRGDIYIFAAVLVTFLPANFVLIPTALLLATRAMLWP